MSQAGVNSISSSGGGSVIETLTGNSGGAVPPDLLFNINVVGNNTTGINVVGMPGSSTLTIVGIQSSTTQRGTLTLATNAEAIAGTDTDKAVTSDDLKAKLGTQTLHGLPIGAGTAAALTWTAAPTNGQLLIGSTGNNPALANLTSTGGTITITNGAGTINLDLTGGGTAIDSFIPDSGTNPVIPTAAGAVTMAGSGSITTVGGLNSLTTQLTGLTNHAVLIGAGTTTITKVGPVAATGAFLASNGVGSDPGFSTATYPLTTTINQILYSSAANTVAGLATANDGVLITSNTGVPSLLANGTTGQLLTATTGSPPSWVTPAFVAGPGSATDNAITRFDGTTGQLIQNSTVTLGDTGIIDDSNSISGGTLSMTLSNTSNTASSNALHQVTVAGTSAGDAFTTYTVAGTTNWSLGVDNSASDAFVVAASTALGTTNIISASTAGEINYPLQPAFLAYLGTTDSNVTGDLTDFAIGTGNALTEVFDQNSDFNTNGTFTAPVTGRYFLQMQIYLNGGTSITDAVFKINTSNRNYRFDGQGFSVATTPQAVNGVSTLADMDSGDTATFSVLTADTGGKVDDIFGAGTPFTWCSGYLAC